jgi:RluA family pseudouridine synthase
LLVVDKPAGLPSQATRADAVDTLCARVALDVGDEVRMMHRLDREASGLVLFARSPAARAPLQAALAAGAIDRTYRAVVSGVLDGSGRVALRIARDAAAPWRRVALPEAAPGGEAASTRYRALARSGGHTLVELSLDTGRTHQIRVHHAALGHPLLGDRLYHGPPAARLMLHAVELALAHPRDGRRLVMRAALPLGFAAPG